MKVQMRLLYIGSKVSIFSGALRPHWLVTALQLTANKVWFGLYKKVTNIIDVSLQRPTPSSRQRWWSRTRNGHVTPCSCALSQYWVTASGVEEGLGTSCESHPKRYRAQGRKITAWVSKVVSFDFFLSPFGYSLFDYSKFGHLTTLLTKCSRHPIGLHNPLSRTQIQLSWIKLK